MSSPPATAVEVEPHGGALGTGVARLRQAPLRDYGVVFGFIALFIVLSIASDVFLTRENLLNIADQWAAIGLMACGQTLVIIAGGFDLSVGAIFALAGILAILATNEAGGGVGILVGLGVGLAVGLINGLLTTVGRINPFIGTLGTSIVLRGLATAITGGFIVSTSSETFQKLGSTKILDARLSVYILLAVVILCIVLLARTKFGRHIYAVGGNPEAARLAGIRVGWVKTGTFAISGVLAGLAGVLVASRVGSVQSNTGLGIEFTVIAAVVIGGNSIFGGEGAIWRAVIGVFLLAMIGNGFNLLGLDPTYQDMVKGGIILLAVAVDAWTRKRR